jgi:hypothetical protein
VDPELKNYVKSVKKENVKAKRAIDSKVQAGTHLLPTNCVAANILRGCQDTAWLPRYCVAANILRGCQHTARLPTYCVAANILRGCICRAHFALAL